MVGGALEPGSANFVEAFLRNEDRGAAKFVTRGVILGARLCRADSRSKSEPQESRGPIFGV